MFLYQNECADGFVTHNLCDLDGLLKVACGSIFGICVEIDLTQWLNLFQLGLKLAY